MWKRQKRESRNSMNTIQLKPASGLARQNGVRFLNESSDYRRARAHVQNKSKEYRLALDAFLSPQLNGKTPSAN